MGTPQYQNILEVYASALVQIAQGAPANETLAGIAHGIESLHRGITLAIFVMDESCRILQIAAAPSAPAGYWQAINDDIAAEAENRIGDPARTVDTEALSSIFCTTSRKHGLPSSTAVPICIGTNPLRGMIAAYAKTRKPPGDDVQQSLRNIMPVIAIAIERGMDEGKFDQKDKSLLDTNSRMALALEGSGTGIWDRNIVTGEIHYSVGWKALFGYSDAEVSNRIEDSYQRVHPDDLAFVQATIQRHFDQETESYVVEHRIRCRDGSYKWASSRGKVISRDAHGKPLRMIGTTTDVTAMHEMSAKVQQSAELITRLTNEIPGLVFQYRQTPAGDAGFSYVSEGIQEIYELTPQQALDDLSLVNERIHPDDIQQYLASLKASETNLTSWHLEYRVILPRQGLRWRQADARPRRLPDDSTEWHGCITDITDRKHTEIELQEFAMIDFLTQLPNRRHFSARMQKDWARLQRGEGTEAAVLMCDLDHFKDINDAHGHLAGDLVLKNFAGILRDALRKNDTVGRVGGEEFAVVLAGAGVAEATAFARRVQQLLAEVLTITNGQTLVVTVSIGIAIMKASDKNADDSLSRSDAALYRAKELGRNRFEIDA